LVKSFDYPRRTGAGPSILPLHHQKYQTAKALDLTVPPALLTGADEVTE